MVAGEVTARGLSLSLSLSLCVCVCVCVRVCVRISLRVYLISVVEGIVQPPTHSKQTRTRVKTIPHRVGSRSICFLNTFLNMYAVQKWGANVWIWSGSGVATEVLSTPHPLPTPSLYICTQQYAHALDTVIYPTMHKPIIFAHRNTQIDDVPKQRFDKPFKVTFGNALADPIHVCACVFARKYPDRLCP